MNEYINKADIRYKRYIHPDVTALEIAVGKQAIDRMPTLDIVRCNECKNYSENIIWETESRPQYFCIKNDHYCKDDWHCADGERRKENE